MQCLAVRVVAASCRRCGTGEEWGDDCLERRLGQERIAVEELNDLAACMGQKHPQRTLLSLSGILLHDRKTLVGVATGCGQCPILTPGSDEDL